MSTDEVDFDVIVVGGGVAGTVCAYRLAQRELDGLLVLPERARVALERGISGELGD